MIDERWRRRFGARLKEARATLDWSQKALAEASSISRKTVIKAEQGEGSPPVEVVAVLGAHGIDLFWLVLGEDRSKVKIRVPARAKTPEEEAALAAVDRLLEGFRLADRYQVVEAEDVADAGSICGVERRIAGKVRRLRPEEQENIERVIDLFLVRADGSPGPG